MAGPAPDLSHLTEEERNIIEAVMERQEALDNETRQLQKWVIERIVLLTILKYEYSFLFILAVRYRQPHPN